MRARVLLFGAIGAVTTGIGVGLLAAPGLVRSIGPLDRLVETIARGDPTLLILAAGLVVAGYVVLAARSEPAPDTTPARTAAERRFGTSGNSPPEAVTTDRRTVAATTVDAEFEAAVECGGPELTAVRGRLATVAAETYAVATGSSMEAAREAIDRGAWTDDPVAAMFLSTGTQPNPPAEARIALWLRPQRERRRRIERTITAIEQLESGG